MSLYDSTNLEDLINTMARNMVDILVNSDALDNLDCLDEYLLEMEENDVTRMHIRERTLELIKEREEAERNRYEHQPDMHDDRSGTEEDCQGITDDDEQSEKSEDSACTFDQDLILYWARRVCVASIMSGEDLSPSKMLSIISEDKLLSSEQHQALLDKVLEVLSPEGFSSFDFITACCFMASDIAMNAREDNKDPLIPYISFYLKKHRIPNVDNIGALFSKLRSFLMNFSSGKEEVHHSSQPLLSFTREVPERESSPVEMNETRSTPSMDQPVMDLHTLQRYLDVCRVERRESMSTNSHDQTSRVEDVVEAREPVRVSENVDNDLMSTSSLDHDSRASSSSSSIPTHHWATPHSPSLIPPLPLLHLLSSSSSSSSSPPPPLPSPPPLPYIILPSLSPRPSPPPLPSSHHLPARPIADHQSPRLTSGEALKKNDMDLVKKDAYIIARQFKKDCVDVHSERGKEEIQRYGDNLYFQAKLTVMVMKYLKILNSPHCELLLNVVKSMQEIHIRDPEEEVIEELFPEQDVKEVLESLYLLMEGMGLNH